MNDHGPKGDACLERLSLPDMADNVRLHFDDREPEQRLDLAAVLIHVCGFSRPSREWNERLRARPIGSLIEMRGLRQ